VDPNHPGKDADESLLDRGTQERQDIDELVPDGLDDEANVTPDPDLAAEESALRVADQAAAPVERE
jgi:hypothetical protein